MDNLGGRTKFQACSRGGGGGGRIHVDARSPTSAKNISKDMFKHLKSLYSQDSVIARREGLSPLELSIKLVLRANSGLAVASTAVWRVQ